MKTWLAKFRIVSAQDSDRPFSPALRQTIARSKDLRAFAEDTANLDTALKQARPAAEPPPSLHAEIMRTIREERPIETKRPFYWAWAPATAVVLLVCLWQLRTGRSAPETQGWSSPVATTMDTGHRLAATMPAEVVSPLSDELQRLNNDLDHAADFLLASLP